MPEAPRPVLSILRLLQVPVVIGLFALLFWRIDVAALRDAIQDARGDYVALVVLLNIPFAVLFGARMQIALRALGHTLSARLVYPIAVLGNVAGAVTPASSGEVLRAGALTSRAGVPLRDAAALVIFERGVSLLYMTVGTVAVGAFFVLPAPAAFAVMIAAVALGLLPAALPLLRAPAASDAAPDAAWLRRMSARLVRGLDRAVDITRNPRTLATWSALTLAIYAVNTLQFWLLARSISTEISIPEAWVALGASQLVGIASLLPFGLGSSDWSLAALLRRFGMTIEQGAAVAVLVRGAATLPLLLMAFASYLYLARLPAVAAAKDTAPVAGPRA
jgi:uncharacterized protein (TIRG00374 family)